MKIEIKIPLKKLLNQRTMYDTGDELYSIKTGKHYGTVVGSKLGERGCEYVFIKKDDGRGAIRSAKRLRKLVRMERDEDKHAETIKKRQETFKKALEDAKIKIGVGGSLPSSTGL